jgi:UDP-4-amino-4,6-dideoxy-N-acetyl-beta-L-altrosamine transaminase
MLIPYGKQSINQADIDSVVNVLKSEFLTQGPQVPAFEKSVSDYCGAVYGVAVNSATSALHIACLALGLGKGDWIWTSSNSFVASANCGLYCSAKVDFIDIDPHTYNLSTKELEKKLIQAKQNNSLPKIVIPVHFAGQSCNMKKISSLSKKYGFKIIEDASHAIGSKYLDKPVGGCQYSDITIFSFHPVKIVTTAEGGLATTNNTDLADKMRLLRSHGITRKKKSIIGMGEDDWHYQQVDLGFNYRMTELQAALGVSQMLRVDKFVAKRHTLQERYDLLLDELPIIKPYQNKDSYSALHLYPIQIDLNGADKSRQQVFRNLRKNNIGVNVHYIPIHTQPYYKKLHLNKVRLPNTEAYYSKTISIPLFHDMTFDQQDQVVSVLKSTL